MSKHASGWRANPRMSRERYRGRGATLSTSLTTDAEWDDRSLPRVGPFATMAVGAVVGFAVGYLYLTEEGRRLRDRLEPWLDQSVDEIRRLREAAMKARRAWDEGRDSLNAVRHLGSGSRGDGW